MKTKEVLDSIDNGILVCMKTLIVYDGKQTKFNRRSERYSHYVLQVLQSLTNARTSIINDENDSDKQCGFR